MSFSRVTSKTIKNTVLCSRHLQLNQSVKICKTMVYQLTFLCNVNLHLSSNCETDSLVHLTSSSCKLQMVLCETLNSESLNESTISWSQFAGQQGKGEVISLTCVYHFHQLHRHFRISGVVTAESSPLHIASSQTQTGNLWFPSASY